MEIPESFGEHKKDTPNIYHFQNPGGMLEQAITTLLQLSEKNIELECSVKCFSFSSKAWTDKKLQSFQFLIFEDVLYCFDFWSQLKESYFKIKVMIHFEEIDTGLVCC